MKNKTIQAILFIASIAGIMDTLFLIDSYYNDPAACSTPFLQSIFGIPVDCGEVTTSQYSKVFSIPLAFYGLVFYLSLFLILYFEDRLTPLLKDKPLDYDFLLLAFGITGFLVSSILLYIQVGLIGKVCLYCLLSLVSSYTVLGTTFVNLKLSKK